MTIVRKTVHIKGAAYFSGLLLAYVHPPRLNPKESQFFIAGNLPSAIIQSFCSGCSPSKIKNPPILREIDDRRFASLHAAFEKYEVSFHETNRKTLKRV